MPDRPGVLGVVASAVGEVGGDIVTFIVVDRQDDGVIGDFIVDMVRVDDVDRLATACSALAGIQVMWLRPYARGGGVEWDLSTLNKMSRNPERALEILTASAPLIFRATWALVIHRPASEVWSEATQSPGARCLGIAELTALTRAAALSEATRVRCNEVANDHSSSPGPSSEWTDIAHRMTVSPVRLCRCSSVSVLAQPVDHARTFVVGRCGGPAFFDSEAARLAYLLSAAGSPKNRG